MGEFFVHVWDIVEEVKEVAKATEVARVEEVEEVAKATKVEEATKVCDKPLLPPLVTRVKAPCPQED